MNIQRSTLEYREVSLRRLAPPPNNLSARQRTYHHLLEVALWGVFSCYNRLSQALANLSHPDQYKYADDNPFLWVEVYNLIDHANRLYDVVFKYPGLPKASFVGLRELLAPVEPLRNHLQHPERFVRRDYFRSPFGLLSWRFEDVRSGAAPTWLFAGASKVQTTDDPGKKLCIGALIARTPTIVPVGHIAFGLGEQQMLRLSDLFLRIQTIPDEYEQALKSLRKDARPSVRDKE